MTGPFPRPGPAGTQAALAHDRPDLVRKGFCIPLTAPFRGVAERRGVLLKGPAGWGEYSPFPGYSDGKEGLAWEAAVQSATRPWPAPVRQAVEVHATIPEVAPEQAARMVAESGCSSAKVKVGDAGEEARVEAVRAALGAGGRLYIDANARWGLDEAVKKIRRFTRYGLDLAEQPVAAIEDMRRLRRLVDVPVAADESVQTPADAGHVGEAEAADVLVVKVQSMGGVIAALRAVERSGLPAIVSSLIETSVGIAAGLALAAALPVLPFSCGLATVMLLEGDLAAEPLIPVNGMLQVRRPEPDDSLVARYRCDLPQAAPYSAIQQGSGGQ